MLRIYNKRFHLLVTIIISSLLVLACSSEPVNNRIAEMLKWIPKEPSTMEDIVSFPEGPLAGSDYKADIKDMIRTVKQYLPPIKEEMNEDDLLNWWRAFHYLFAEKYPDPQKIYEEKTWESLGFPEVNLDNERFLLKNQINVLIILDVSGSMANEINGSPMIDIAKKAIFDFVSDLPQDAQIGLRIYGHEGLGTGASPEKSCTSSELIYGFQTFNTDLFQKSMEPYEPTGWTPLAFTLEQAKEDLSRFPGEQNTNLVYVVSDGIETCNGDPIAVAKSFSESNIQPIINVIGFNVDDESQDQLKDIAEIGKGVYTQAGNQEQLEEIFKEAERMIKRFEEWEEVAKADISFHKEKQIEQLQYFMDNFSKSNNNERMNLFYVINELRSEGFITDSAHSYFALKRDERNKLYLELQEDTYENLKEKIENNYETLLYTINRELKEDLENVLTITE